MLESGFANNPININELPDVSLQTFQPISPRYLFVLRISNSIFLLILLIAFCSITLTQVAIEHWIFLGGVGIWILCYLMMWFFTRASVRNKSFAVRTHDISFKTGVFFKEWTTVSFNRVQHCEITKGVIDNLVGLAELKIFTAGGSSSDLAIPGLQPELAVRLKEHILNEIKYQDEEE